MKKKLRKLIKFLKPYHIDTYVYRYDLARPIPDLQAKIPIDLKHETAQKIWGKSYVFRAYHNNRLANETHLVFGSLLAKQVGLGGKPILGNGATHPDFRGNNIHGFMLTSILKYYKQLNEQQVVYMFIDPDNLTVMKVMDKVGCERVFRAKVFRVLGLCIRKTITVEP